MTTFRLNVNGQTRPVDTDADTPLLYVLRNDLQLNGAKFGCGLGQCGACTVLVGKDAVLSCLMPVSGVGERPVRTVEGLGSAASPGALQRAFIEEQAAQCGYCIAGMIMRAQALLESNPNPSDADIRGARHERAAAAKSGAAQAMHGRRRARGELCVRRARHISAAG